MTRTYEIWVDGSFHRHIGGIAAAIFSKRICLLESRQIQSPSSHHTEIQALRLGLWSVAHLRHAHISFYSDCQSIVDQLNRKEVFRDNALTLLSRELRCLAQSNRVRVEWIPGHSPLYPRNHWVDRIAKEARRGRCVRKISIKSDFL